MQYVDGYSTGSGFVAKSDNDVTLIATNYHADAFPTRENIEEFMAAINDLDEEI